MNRSNSRRSPPPRSSRTGGVVLESVTTMVNGREVDTKVYAAPSSSRTASARLPPPSLPIPTIVRALPSSRLPSPPRTSSRTPAHSKQPSTSKRIVYAYPDRSIAPAAQLQERQQSRRASVDQSSRNPYPADRRARDESRSRAPLIEDAYGYKDADDIYTEPRVRTSRRGSVDATSSRRPMSMYESFPPTNRSTREYGPPPTTRGLDKINSGGGITRQSSLRDSRMRSPPRYASRDAYASDEDRYAGPSRTSTAITRPRAQDRGPPASDVYDDRRTSRRPSPADEQIPDRGVSGRGFGLVPGAGDYTGYSKVEAPSRAPPLSGYLEAPEAVKGLSEYIPDLDRGDRQHDAQERSRKAPPRERERFHEDERDYDARKKRHELYDTQDYDSDTRPRDREKRREPRDARPYEDDERMSRGRRGGGDDKKHDDHYRQKDDRYESDHDRRHELATGAEAALGAGAAAYAAKAIGKDRQHRDQGGSRDESYGRDKDAKDTRRERPRDFYSPPSEQEERSRGAKGKERERDRISAQDSKEARTIPETEGGEVPQHVSGSPEEPRRRRYVSGGEPGSSKRDEPAATIDPDEDYRRRMEQETNRASKGPSPIPAPEARDPQDPPRRASWETPSPEDPRQRYVPPDVRPPNEDDPADSLILARANPPRSSSNNVYSDPDADASLAVPPDPDRNNSKVRILEPTKSILRKPRDKFPEPPITEREGVAPLDKEKAKSTGAPPDARWTKVKRDLVNPAALDRAGERYQEADDYVTILRVLSREEIQELATLTRRIRDERYEERMRMKGGKEKEMGREVRQIEWDGET